MQGSPRADYPPPLVPLDPVAKPADPFGPPTALPRVGPSNITGCDYAISNNFTATDVIPLPGRDAQVPKVTTWAEFVNVLQAGNLYVNVHNTQVPAGIIRGHLVSIAAGGSGTAGTTGTGGDTTGTTGAGDGTTGSTGTGAESTGSGGTTGGETAGTTGAGGDTTGTGETVDGNTSDSAGDGATGSSTGTAGNTAGDGGSGMK